MTVDEDTRLEVEYALGSSFPYPDEYIAFAFKWIAFNRAYNDSETGGDKERVLSFGDKHNERWNDVKDLAIQLASQECIGGERISHSRLLKPKAEVKSATLFLRKKLELDNAVDPTNCKFSGCMCQEKRDICNQIHSPDWMRSEVAALLRLVYQVRCNLIHGQKSLALISPQFERDRQLVHLGKQVMECVLAWIIANNE